MTVLVPEARAQQPGERVEPPPQGLWQPVPGAAVASVAEPGALAELRILAEERGDPTDWLALGAALLHSGDWEGATAPLRRALELSEPENREDASFDLALAHAVSARPGDRTGSGEDETDLGTPRDRLLRARDGFRAVLRENPAADDARWNLELVERWLEQEGSAGAPESGGGGGGGAAGAPDEGGGSAEELSEEELQRLLAAAADQEREVQNRRLERNQGRDPRVERNW